jgi:hypothetical protein
MSNIPCPMDDSGAFDCVYDIEERIKQLKEGQE